MHVEIFTLCDAATVDAVGKLNILGSFDRLSAASEPIVHMQCALALKLRFARIEEGQKRFRLAFVDSDGKAVMQPLDGTTEVRFQDQDSTEYRVDGAWYPAIEIAEIRRVFDRSRDRWTTRSLDPAVR